MIHYRSSRNALRIFLAANFAALTLNAALAQRSHTPRPGSAERAAIMDAIRPTCERDLKQPVIFKVTLLNVGGDWAAARVMPIKPNGNEIDFSKTHYREDDAEGAFDSVGEALLRRRNGAWSLVKWRFGGTDTELSMWLEEFGLPASLGRSE